ncbi:mannose-1-phosphate guanylyltransferase/mannose-6-phosphate isomerase [Acidovorax sp. 1608163]|uniref:mannose-1-phosphate guanylyltransferase/mannose-6-phosphate isomerase n=1 Tax=Acidovorax sp. 1608163 TaxID=2478662 RepID=UPI000EF6B5F3|nr:mannose-1-phosphate guanylyltransferase/mannose-6-phosphate isomerase [Acidovorax sp. 1608163]AYM97609.1 mannose-1-phosphate guanylyltransferase/mannose-6-phosphate isomerase [Acidovorax sp. 1608163]
MTCPLLPVILCGGSGTRLFPLSRESYPKQFLALAGEQTMLQQTAMRLHGFEGDVAVAFSPLLVCNEDHRFLAANQLLEIGIRHADLILEPVARNTAPALALAALHARAGNEDPVMLVMPADHVIRDMDAFHHAVRLGYGLASEGGIVTFGVVPQHPETGYGYIQYRREQANQAFPVEGFTEKPSLALAKQYLAQGNYLWNSGIFMMRPSIWLKALVAGRPDILSCCEGAMQAARCDMDFIRPSAAAFESCPSDSIDYAVMEKLPAHPEWGIPISVVPLQAGWSDVGSWDALWSVLDRDNEGNAVVGDAVQHHGCSGSLFLSSSRLVAGIGLKDVVVVETPDAVLIADKRCTQEVKAVVAQLNQKGNKLASQHRKVHRPWGWYDLIDSGERFQVKRIVVNPGASLSLQMHKYRAEHWVVVKGIAEVTHGDRCFQLQEDESTYIPLGQTHRLSNPGTQPLEIIEIQSGSYLGEDDIVRLDDVYGRVPPVSKAA